MGDRIVVMKDGMITSIPQPLRLSLNIFFPFIPPTSNFLTHHKKR